VEKVVVIVGRLLATKEACSDVNSECNSVPVPMANTRILGLKGAVFTDDEGFFQAEMSSRTERLEVHMKGKPCFIDLSELAAVDGVIRANRLYCSIPEPLRGESGK